MRLSKKSQIEANKEVLKAVDRYNEEIKGTVLHQHNTFQSLIKIMVVAHMVAKNV